MRNGYVHVCSTCGALGKPTTRTKGSFLIELLLWVLFCAPGLIYSIWRLTSKERDVCASCGGKMLSIYSPRGVDLVRQYHP